MDRLKVKLSLKQKNLSWFLDVSDWWDSRTLIKQFSKNMCNFYTIFYILFIFYIMAL